MLGGSGQTGKYRKEKGGGEKARQEEMEEGEVGERGEEIREKERKGKRKRGGG